MLTILQGDVENRRSRGSHIRAFPGINSPICLSFVTVSDYYVFTDEMRAIMYESLEQV